MKVKRAIKYKVTCSHCGSEIEFVLDDVEFGTSCMDFGGFINCPCCGRIIQTHDGYWTSKKYCLLKTVDVIFEEKEFEYRKLQETDPETEKTLKKLFKGEQDEETDND